jgi:hypothetical protein
MSTGTVKYFDAAVFLLLLLFAASFVLVFSATVVLIQHDIVVTIILFINILRKFWYIILR